MSENGARPELPERWKWEKLGEIVRTSSGGTPSRNHPEYYEDGTVPWLKIGDLSDGVVNQADEQITEEALAGSSAKKLPAGTLVIAMYGSIGKLGFLGLDAATNQAICALETEDEVLRSYLFWYLRGQRKALLAAGFGGTQANISQTFLKRLPIPLPPQGEQKSIVEEVEQLWSTIDSGQRHLRQAERQLGALRTAIVEDELAPTRDPDNGSAPEWTWVTPPEIATDERYSLAIGPFGSNLKVSDYADEGVPLVFVRSIRSGTFAGPETRFVTREKAKELEAHRVESGDLLITKMGDPPGDCAIYPSGFPEAIVTADCIRFAVAPEKASPEFVALLFWSATVKRQISERTKGVAQKKISLDTFKSVQLPLPPREKQDAIVDRARRADRASDSLRREVLRANARAEDLRTTMLRSAFSQTKGELPR